MESVVLLGLMGVGYLMNKDKDDKHKIYSEVQPPLFNGSGNSVYDQANYLDAKKYEINLMNKNHDEAMKGDSKVIDSLNMSGGRNTLKDSILNFLVTGMMCLIVKTIIMIDLPLLQEPSI